MQQKLMDLLSRKLYHYGDATNQRSAKRYLYITLLSRRKHQTSPELRASIGLFNQDTEQRYKSRPVRERLLNTCVISARRRGNHRRFSLARTRIRTTSRGSRLLGVQKSSW